MMLQFLFIISILAGSNEYENTKCAKIGDVPPGTRKVATNFYADKTEISILNYREYLYWLQRTFGTDSGEYLSALPDMSVFATQADASRVTDADSYFSLPDYEEFPVVGISYLQAVAYGLWRSDRVYEKLLIDAGYILADMDQDRETHFTTAKYLTGQYPLAVTDPKPVRYPVYSLPTVAEWEQIAGHRHKNGNVAHAADKGPAPLAKSKRLTGLEGNVSEMTAAQGICMGINWTDPAGTYRVSMQRKYISAEPWLGMRFICSWQNP